MAIFERPLVGLLAAAAVLLAYFPASAQIREERVNFAPGASSARIEGRLHGETTIDYKLGARAGQTMTVDFRASNSAAYFNVLAPGSTGEAIFIGSMAGSRFEGRLPANGDYTVRVYLYRAAARNGETSTYTIDVAIKAAGAAESTAPDPKAIDASSRASAGKFDATGIVPCARYAGQPMGQCNFGVARAGGGSATVVVTMPDGRTRTIFFERGRAVGADISQADGAAEFSARKEADLHLIRVGHERYEIVDAVIFGG